MAAVQLRNIRSIRNSLGRSQAEMAEILGVSLRAIQSYEQGWRPTPSYVQQAAALMLFLNWRRSGVKITPCWRKRNCSTACKRTCLAYNLKAGDLCWLIIGTACNGTRERSWEAKLAKCSKCEVMQQWLPKGK